VREAWPWRTQRRTRSPGGAGSRTRDDLLMCRVMRHLRQPAAGMASILDAAPHHDEACATPWTGNPRADGRRVRVRGFAAIGGHRPEGSVEKRSPPPQRGLCPPHQRISLPRTCSHSRRRRGSGAPRSSASILTTRQLGTTPPATCRRGWRKAESSRLQRASRRCSNRPSLPRFSMSTRGAAPGRGSSSTLQRSRRCWRSRSTWVAGRSEERPAAMASGTEDRPSRRPRARAGGTPRSRGTAGKGQPMAASSHSPGARAAAWEGPPARGPCGTQELVAALSPPAPAAPPAADPAPPPAPAHWRRWTGARDAADLLHQARRDASAAKSARPMQRVHQPQP
jgi:hypothetical protein